MKSEPKNKTTKKPSVRGRGKDATDAQISEGEKGRAPSGISANGASLRFEAKLFKCADTLRGAMDPSEYKHVVLGLIFLKHISDSFDTQRAALLGSDYPEEAEDADSYKAENVFWVPEEAHWSYLRKKARTPRIGRLIDEAMRAIEDDNPRLKGVLSKDYSRPAMDQIMLGDLIGLISKIALGEEEDKAKDIFGRVYEYFLSQFAGKEGKRGGDFYTPGSVVRVMVDMLEPYKGRVYDPCCGSGGMFIQSEAFVEKHGGRIGNIAIYGQESNHTTWRLCQMNLGVRRIPAEIRWNSDGSFHKDEFPDLKFDYILANPPFNISQWGGERLRDDPRWKFGIPPAGNANFAWLQHIVHHLSPSGTAGVVLANGSMSSTQSGEADIRRKMVEKDVVDCMIAMPGQLFYSTQIPVCLWFLARSKKNGKFRDRRGEVLFIDARKKGHMVDRIRREFSDDDIEMIAGTYHRWREGKGYEDVPGFCKAASLEEIRDHNHILTPGRYVGAEAAEEDSVPFDERMAGLSAALNDQISESGQLSAAIKKNLKTLKTRESGDD